MPEVGSWLPLLPLCKAKQEKKEMRTFDNVLCWNDIKFSILISKKNKINFVLGCFICHAKY